MLEKAYLPESVTHASMVIVEVYKPESDAHACMDTHTDLCIINRLINLFNRPH